MSSGHAIVQPRAVAYGSEQPRHWSACDDADADDGHVWPKLALRDACMHGT